MTKRPRVIGLLILTVLLSGCAAHRPGGQQPTPFEKVMSVNAQIAELNNVIARGIIAAQRAGLMDVPTAARILDAQKMIALDHQQVTYMLARGPDFAKLNGPQLRQLVSNFQYRLLEVLSRGGLAVKNPQSQQSFEGDIRLMSTLADTLASDLQAAGIL